MKRSKRAPKPTRFILPEGSESKSPPMEDLEDEFQTKVTKIKNMPAPVNHGKEGFLVIMYPPEAGLGKRISIKESSSLVIGRHPDVPLHLNVDSVSRRHAQIDNIDGTFTIRDLGSTNGTYINDKPIRRQPLLQNGDIIRIGTVLLKFLTGADIEANYHDDVYRLTIIDALTEAYNKRYLLDFMEREIERSKRGNEPLSLVMIDIDHFKKFNDTYGHLIGDLVLREVARRIQSTVRKNEIFARYGGEEFSVLLPVTDAKGAVEFAERARRVVCDTPLEAEGNQVTVTISLGVFSFCPPGSMSSDELIKLADANLYRAKQAGRNQVVS
ncbi:diguanylate cyclase [Myxococcota bacterium]|nr:diguanylate cyclase [Myxococcota bacterium]